MSAPNSVDEAFVMLPELALGLLPAADAERVMAFVRESPRLQQELASLRGTSAAIGESAPAVEFSAERRSALKDRLMARAAAASNADATGSVEQPVTETAPPLRLERTTPTAAPERVREVVREVIRPAPLSFMQRAAPLAALATAAALAVSVFRTISVAAELDRARQQLAVAKATTTTLQTEIASRDEVIALISAASTQVVELASTGAKAPGARAFVNRDRRHYMITAHDLGTAPNGRIYQLWLLTKSGAPVSAALFNTDGAGRALVHADVPLDGANLAGLAITEEPAGGSPQPTGAILVAGYASR